MGKKQHQKDKLYLTCTEWSTLYGGKKAEVGAKAKFRRLPFSCCSLSMQPFEYPLCTKEGVIFDLISIVPFLKKYGINPVSGEKLLASELVKLNFHKNAEGKYHCPVTFRVFNENTHIVAIKETGNVFSYEAVERLNLKVKFFKDLLSDEPFSRRDIITIQDPSNLDKFNLANFFHIKKNLKVADEDAKEAKKRLKNVNIETRDILAELEKEYQAPKPKELHQKKADAVSSAHYSTGKVSASFTSTAIGPETVHEAAIIDEDVLRYQRVKKKGYVKMFTNFGNVNIELHCDMLPKTCENFLKLCAKGYYNETVFHRSIRNFMIQGGDPTASGTGGESLWGESFKDEFKPNLTHSGRGVLSMANSGPNTNKSQFFFTFRSCRHLDNKHTVFGRVVGGLDTLDKMEAIKTDKKDKPLEDIKLLSCRVFVDPYEEADELLAKDRAQKISDQKQKAEQEKKQRFPKKTERAPKVFKSGVGKYINTVALKRVVPEDDDGESKKKKVKDGNFGNFNAW